MTAKLRIAKKNTGTTLASTPGTKLKLSSSKKKDGKSSRLPDRPSPNKGPRALKQYSSGKRLVVRFFVSSYGGRNPWNPKQKELDSPFYVMDADSGQRAKGSKLEGYDTKEEAAEVCREFREKYGAYAKSEF